MTVSPPWPGNVTWLLAPADAADGEADDDDDDAHCIELGKIENQCNLICWRSSCTLKQVKFFNFSITRYRCLLYTSDAADE